MGTYRGELNERLQNFISEFEKSGLINSLMECALFERNSPEIKTAFLQLHKLFTGLDKSDGENLYEKLFAAFKATSRELCKDKVLFALVNSVHNDIISRLEKIDLALSNSHRASTGAKKIDFESLSPLIVKIARGLQAHLKNIRIETNKGARSVDITRIFIPPKLGFRENKRNESRINQAVRALDSVQKKRGAHKTEPAFADLPREIERLKRVTYNELSPLFRKIVVLGDPGGGKSTLCQRLCYELAKQSMLVFQHGERDQIEAQIQKLPFRIILRAFEKARSTDAQLSIYEYLCRDLANHVAAEISEIRVVVKYLLINGRAVIAFDGLDEILDTSQRRDFVDLVVSFCDQYPLCPVLVTSRLVGYDDASLPGEFEELILEKFDDDEVFQYVKKFMQVVVGEKSSVAEFHSKQFVKQTSTNAHDLRRNPLMLGLMCWLFNQRRDVPSNRPEIYRECAILMFERWDPDRGVLVDIPRNFDRLQLFSELASQMYGRREYIGGVDLSWLERRIRAFFEKLYEDKSRAIEATKSLIKFLIGRAWIMTEVGDKVFSFTHQTFLEYFFAKHIDDGCDTVQEVFEVIESRSRKSAQDDKWSFCLTAGTLRPANQERPCRDDRAGTTHRPSRRRWRLPPSRVTER